MLLLSLCMLKNVLPMDTKVLLFQDLLKSGRKDDVFADF
jgi:hypothetical protein